MSVPDSAHSEAYEIFHQLLPGRDLLFMNHGYARLNGRNDLSWLRKSDRKYLFNALLLQRVLRGVKISRRHVLEVGCGRGGNVLMMSRYFAANVVGLDFSAGAVRSCLRLPERGLRFLQGSAIALPFSGEAFDAVVNIESSHGYPDRAAFYAEMHRVLRPGGVFCYADCLRSAEMLRAEESLKHQGFQFKARVDITANVILGITQGRTAYRRILLNAAASAEGRDRAEQLLLAIHGPILEGYRSGNVRYMLWQLRKTP